MSNRFYPGDPCPKCSEPIKRHGRTIWTVFLREPFLKCPSCKRVFRRFPSALLPDADDVNPAPSRTPRALLRRASTCHWRDIFRTDTLDGTEEWASARVAAQRTSRI